MARLVGEAPVPTWRSFAVSAPWSVTRSNAFRPLALTGLALTSIAGYAAFHPLAPAALVGQTAPITLLTTALWVPYALACWLLLACPAPLARGWRRLEWAVLAGAALIFRALLLPIPPLLSRDAYRYLWDANLTAHGLSPYLHGPAWPGYDALRDPRFYTRIPWSNVPTIYPPGAQFLYRLAYAIAPHNVWMIKGEMTILDLLAGVALVALLVRRRQDPRRAFIYLWAPLPIVEFALNGHVDAAAVALITAALWANTTRFRGSRALVGILIAAATLVKLYPIALVLALGRRRDWGLAAALAATLALGYAPYWHEGFAALGFLDTYLTQVHINYGGALLALRWLGGLLNVNIIAVQAVGVAGAAASVAVVVWLRPRGSDSPLPPGEGLGVRSPDSPLLARSGAGGEDPFPSSVSSVVHPPPLRLGPLGAAAVLIVIWLAFSPHIFPWYAAALLPFCAATLAVARHVVAALALGAWLLTGLLPLTYIAYVSDSYAWLYPAMYLVTAVLTLALIARAWPRLAAWRASPWRASLPALTARDARTSRSPLADQPRPDDVPTRRA